MTAFKSLALIGAVTLIPAIANAAPPQRTATSIAMLPGTCSTLVLDGLDLPCEGRVVNTTWSDGRSSFMFFIPFPQGIATVTFSGRGSEQIHPNGNPDEITQPMDTLFFNLGGDIPPARPEPIIGTCHWTNPFNGPSVIDCAIEAKGGKSTVFFDSDGSKPKFITDPRLLRSLSH